MRIFFLLLFFPSFLLSQQDWDLFPLHQKTYFQVENEIEEYYCDSVLIEDELQKHYFGAAYLFESFGGCTGEIVQEFWINQGLDYELKTDTLYSDESHYFSIINQDTLDFFHLANVGESWEVPTATGHSFRLTMNEIIEEVYLDFTDSLKVFEIQYLENGEEALHSFNDFTFKLSKQSGFMQFLPFAALYFGGEITDVRLIAGMKKGEQRHGYTSDFEDFFHYEIGDVLKWHTDYKSEPGDNFTRIEEWFLDTVTNVYFDGFFLKLDVDRTIYTEKSDNDGVYENYTDVGINAVFSFSKILMDSLLSTPIYHPVPLLNRLRYLRKSPTFTTIGIEEVADFVMPKEYFLEDCSTVETSDLPGFFKLNSALGFTFTEVRYSEESNYVLELLGFQSGEFSWGELEGIYVSVAQPIVETPIEIFPNPASDFMQIEIPENLKNAKLIIVNNNGLAVLQKDLDTGNLISISDLRNGFYSLKIESENGNYFSKFVVFK